MDKSKKHFNENNSNNEKADTNKSNKATPQLNGNHQKQ